MATKESEVERIQNYLEQQNRPYSLNDVFMNLHKDIGKTALQKCLDQLVQCGKVKEKLYGKQKVYITDQSKFPTVDDTQLKQMERDVGVLGKEVSGVAAEVQKKEATIKSLLTAPTTEEALADLKKFEDEISALEERLSSLQQNQSLVSEEQRLAVTEQRSSAIKQWKKRKRLTTDMLDAILEGYPKSKKQLIEEIGVETDEDAGVTVPQL